MRWAAAALLFSIVISGAMLVAQTPVRDRTVPAPPTGSALLRGRVVAAATGDALRHAVVRLTGGKTAIAPVLTDEEGRFEFSQLPAGSFTITTSKPGFARTSSHAEVAARATTVVSDIALPRGAVITGFTVEPGGEPIAGGVTLSRIVERADGSIQRITVANAASDDLGAFRFGSLPADTYTVTSQQMASGLVMTPPPGTDLNRTPFRVVEGPRIRLRAGDEHSGVVVVMPADRPAPPRPAPAEPRLAITVRGRITRSGRPATGTFVQLMPAIPAGPVDVARADENGRYEVVLPRGVEGDYRILARRQGYEFAEFGAQGNRRGSLLHLKPGETLDDIDVALKKLSTISGRILDDFGDPVEGALVRVAQLRYADGQRKLVDAPGTTPRTDDLGRYRVAYVRPGQYAVSAAVGQVVVTEPAADFPGYSTTYFPGTTAPGEIQLLSVGSSQELADIDFRLVRQRTFKVAGHASDSAGDPVTGGISLQPRRRSGSIASVQLGAKIDPDGGFEFSNVPAGEYVLQVLRGANRNAYTEGEFAYRFIDIIDSDVVDLDVQTGLGSTIAGHVTFDGGEAPPLDGFDLSAMPADLDRSPQGATASARFDDQNRFELARIHGPRRLQARRLPAGWMLRSVIVNGLDVTDEPLPFGREDQSLEDVEVIVTNRVTRLAGQIAETREVAPTDVAVLAFSSQRDRWYLNTRYIRRTVPQANGSFSFDGIPPGEYYLIAAYPPDDPGDWRDPEMLEKLALQATRARVSEGQQVSVELRIR